VPITWAADSREQGDAALVGAQKAKAGVFDVPALGAAG
jgi:hypothetical protein